MKLMQLTEFESNHLLVIIQDSVGFINYEFILISTKSRHLSFEISNYSFAIYYNSRIVTHRLDLWSSWPYYPKMFFRNLTNNDSSTGLVNISAVCSHVSIERRHTDLLTRDPKWWCLIWRCVLLLCWDRG